MSEFQPTVLDFHQVDDTHSIMVLRNLAYVEQGSRIELGQSKYSDLNWAALFKSKMVDVGLTNKDSDVVVINQALPVSHAVLLKQFGFLSLPPQRLQGLLASDDSVERIREVSTNFKGLYPEPYVSFLRFFVVEESDPKEIRGLCVVEDIAHNYGKPGYYVYHKKSDDTVSIAIVSADKKVEKIDIAQFFEQLVPLTEGACI